MRGHEQDITAFEAFEQALREALAHLYDPAYRPSEVLWKVTGCDPQQGLPEFQTAIIRAIQDLEPTPHAPPTARSRRIYGLLSYCYVKGMTQEEAAERLSITPRHLRRERPGAVHALALHLWEQSRTMEELTRQEEICSPETLPPEYLSQVRQELTSLQEGAPNAVADVGEEIDSAIKWGSTLTSRRGVGLKVECTQPNLVAAIHPTALRQILLAAIGQLAQRMSSGLITLRAGREEGHVKIIVTGQPATTSGLPDGVFLREMLAGQGGSVKVSAEEDCISFHVALPSADLVVLVVDDNADLIHLYRRYVLGTRYRIVHVAQGQRVFETVEASPPDVIVLDVMLPDADGWELLAHLHERSATRFIPIIVCSVVREEDLAMALGATLYLPKPVERPQFLRALDQVISRAAARAPKSRANNAAIC